VIDLARAGDVCAGITYQACDISEEAEVRALHERLGDANLYVRGILHQILPEHRDAAVAALACLAGRTGVIYVLEPQPAAEAYFRSLSADGPLPALAAVVDRGIRPGGLDLSDIRAQLCRGGRALLTEGRTVLHTTHVLADGETAQMPACYMAVGPATAGHTAHYRGHAPATSPDRP
jgi:hypothetical protein